MKTCSKCGIPKLETEFSFRSDRPTLRHSWCKLCKSRVDLARYHKNPEKQNVLSRKRYSENPEARNKSSREWASEHREQARKNARESRKRQYHTDRAYRMEAILRARLGAALNSGGSKKALRTLELLGCPLVWLEAHLESLFQPGMTWENHGPVWHIDHKRPCAAFDLANPEHQKICFHWTNLQPLFAADNLRKSNKL